MYEECLAFNDKLNKKNNGQYYTPSDVCDLLVEQALEFPDGIWCDPCCGIGNISFKLIEKKPELLNTMIFCDIDLLSLKTCRFLFSKFFNKNYYELNNFYNINFLSEQELNYDYIIMNPPYIKLAGMKEDLYISFMKKACCAKGFVSITPQTFTNSSNKASKELREKISNFRKVKIYNFDNVPDMIFNGKKKGIFNTNTSNSVRAAITVCNNSEDKKEITPLLRWRTEERKNMFERKNEFLSELTVQNNIFLKLYPNTKEYLNFGNTPLKSILSKNKTEFKLTIPSTPRYYITASIKELSRGSKHEIYFNSKEDMLKCYLILNSSYSYWWWRINDGCITLTKTVLENLPIKNIEINEELISKLLLEEETNLVVKKNAGILNENIKHSLELIKEINNYLGFSNLEKIQQNSIL